MNRKYVVAGIVAAVLIALLFLHGLPRVAPVGVVENVQGIPYPQEGEEIVVLEPLAHVDVKVTTVVARQLTLTFSFIPEQVSQLSVGIRENPFWLSYTRQTFYEASSDGLPPEQSRRVSITLPLTDKLQDRDGTIDIMFFAGADDAIALAQTPSSHVSWRLSGIEASTSFTWPTFVEGQDFLQALLTRERPQ